MLCDSSAVHIESMLVYRLGHSVAAAWVKLERDNDPDGYDSQRDGGRKISRKGPFSPRIDLFDIHAIHGLQVKCKPQSTVMDA